MVKEENECKIIFNIFLVYNNIGKKEIKKNSGYSFNGRPLSE